MRSIIYTWGVSDHFLYDANPGSKSEDGTLRSVFFCRFLFQLHHSVSIRRTANADLLYEKGQTADTGHYTGSDDRYHYLQGGSGCNRSGDLAVWKGIPERLPRTVYVGVLPGSRAEYFLCYLYADPCICSGSGKMDHGKRSETD